MAFNIQEKPQVLKELESSISFEIPNLKKTQVADDSIACRVCLPIAFIRAHPEYQKERVIYLQAMSSPQSHAVALGKSKSKTALEVKLGRGWRQFTQRAGIKLGDSLVFKRLTLLHFQVYIFRTVAGSVSSPHVHVELAQGCNRQQQQQHRLAEQADRSPVPPHGPPQKRPRAAREDVPIVPANLHPPAVEVNVPEQRFREPVAANNANTTPPALPSFIARLVEYNVQDSADSAGIICGPCFEIPASFVRTYGVQLQAHVKLQGVRTNSPSRYVVCTSDILHRDGPPLSLGWSEFVRDNELRAGHDLLFTLISESFFEVRMGRLVV